jgi:predicted metalloprotease with PDZ domain
MRMKYLLVLTLIIGVQTFAQDKYRYEVNLNNVKDDKVTVTLKTPKTKNKVANFIFPKIIPGTYKISDYGRFISNLVALDQSGKSLPVKKTSDNTWRISNADKLATIRYEVDDTWDTESGDNIYPMAGTNIEEGKNFTVNTPGFFGHFEDIRNIPVELRFERPLNFYAATALIPRSADATDEFVVDNIDELYDSPIMFSVPDTTTIRVANTDVLVAVYSPKKLVQSKFIAQLMTNMLNATAKYLGGRLPVDKYAFLFYFNGEQRAFKLPGALEHNTSSFYSLPELPQQTLAANIMDITAHEFFHIVSPLTISSKEIKEFNFTKAVLSKHLWLYEGSTEYASDHAQVKYGLNTVSEFLDKLAQKIKNTKTVYNDKIPFTELSVQAAGRHQDQFGNVYEKGAIISACLDLYLLHLSNGAYDLAKLKHDLSIKFGRKSAFEDNQLFDIITEMTYPPVREFFRKYVENNTPIPYETFFGYAGIKYSVVPAPKDTTSGSASKPNAKGKDEYRLEFMPNPDMQQATVRQAWLTTEGKGIAIMGDKNDVAEIDNIIKTLYDVISGDAGPRNWERFRSLYTTNAFMGMTAATPGGGSRFITFTPEEYIKRNGPAFLKDSFREKEISRTVNQFGNIAQVFTTYEYNLGNGKAIKRGINSVQLVKEQGRWWIASIVWQEENKDLPIPAQYSK